MARLTFARAAWVVLALVAGTAGCSGHVTPPVAAPSCTGTAAASTASPSPCATIMATESTSPAAPAGDQKWQGTVNVKITDAGSVGTCVGTYRADIVLSVPPGGPASGEGTVADAPINSCGETTDAIVGQVLHITAPVRDYAFTFDSTHFSPGTGPVVVKMTGPGHARASGSGTVRRSVGPAVLTTVLTFDLSCTNCG